MVMFKHVFMALLLVIGMISGAIGAEPAKPEQPQAADETAIQQVIEAYVDAYNKGDAAAVAAFWSDDAEYVSPSGERFKGRKEIQGSLEKTFAENKNAKLEVTVSSMEFPSADKAVERGTATITVPDTDPDTSLYVAEYGKKDGKWKLTSVQEEEVCLAYPHLKELEWLIGEWIDPDEDSSVQTTFEWTKNKSFITGSFVVRVGDEVDLQGTQVIGWDPVHKTIRSWVFDSKGGFGQGNWLKQGNEWIAEMKSVLSSGEKACAVNIYTYIDGNSFSFQSIGREIGGQPAPNIEPVVVERAQPQESADSAPEEVK